MEFFLQEIFKKREEERESLRKELQTSREQIHALHEARRKDTPICSKCSQRGAPAQDTGEQHLDFFFFFCKLFCCVSSSFFFLFLVPFGLELGFFFVCK